MKKRKMPKKTKAAPKPKRDDAWFEQQIAELKADLEKLSVDRREQFERELDRDAGPGRRD